MWIACRCWTCRSTGAHDVIGDRAFATDPATVIDLGRAQIEGLMEGGVLPVMKHIPGHGRAGADSHLDAAARVAPAPRNFRASDFVTFRSLDTCPMAMTAHVVYESIDPQRPATTSPKVIRDVIRGEIGFDGLLMSDDLSMKALDGPLSVRAKAALFAGCDVVLHCNGKMDEMREVATEVKALEGACARSAASTRSSHLARAGRSSTRRPPRRGWPNCWETVRMSEAGREFRRFRSRSRRRRTTRRWWSRWTASKARSICC